ncbi:MAG: glycosyltransferase family 39 protein [Acidobacteria bacterium]|nr:glycosyltransferase family 39 protein [Acidobacteriota bacterium]
MTSDADTSIPGRLERPSRATLRALAVILSAGLLLKLIPIVVLAMSPPFTLGDLDRYAYAGAYVADHPGRWMWLRDVVQFGQYLKAPLYPALMCVIALIWRSGFPLNAAIFQVLISVASGVAMFRIGQRLHSSKTGLIATALYMFYLPNFATPMFGQEALFIPLSLAAFSLHLELVATGGRPRAFALAGFLYGLTALTRSLPLYYLPPVAALHVLWAPRRRPAIRQATALLVGMFLTILPYSFFISSRWNHWVFVDTQGVRAVVETYSDHPDSHRPGMVESLSMVAKAFVASPVKETQRRISQARAFFYLKGGQWLQVDAPRLATSAGAWTLKALVHLVYDLPTAAILLLSPIGFALARGRREAMYLILWPLVALALMIAFLWSGGRYTASFLPQLMLGASVVLAGGWRRPNRGAMVLAIVCAAIIAIPVGLSVPLTAWGRADYGIRFKAVAVDGPQLGHMSREAGFSTFTDGGRVELALTPDSRQPTGETGTWIEVRVDGVRQPMVRWAPGKTERVGISTPARLVFIEVRLVSGAGRSIDIAGSTEIEVVVGRAGRS